MSDFAKKAIRSKKFVQGVEHLLKIGMDDDVGATMFSGANIELSEDTEKIIIKTTPNSHYFDEMDKKGKKIEQWIRDVIIN